MTDYERYQLEWMIEHGYSLASIEREVRHVPEQSHDGGPCPPGGPER